MPQHRDELRELDAQIGDGDLGITVAIGMKAIGDGLPDLEGEEPGTILARSGSRLTTATQERSSGAPEQQTGGVEDGPDEEQPGGPGQGAIQYDTPLVPE